MSDKNFKILQKLQNKAMRVILKCNKRTHVIDMLNALGWLSIKQKNMYNTMLIMYKIHKKLIPEYLYDKIIMNNDIHDHYTRNSNKFHQMSQKSTTMNRSIYQSRVKVFNTLPNDCIESKTLNVFKTKLITILEKIILMFLHETQGTVLCISLLNYISLYAKSNKLIQ